MARRTQPGPIDGPVDFMVASASQVRLDEESPRELSETARRIGVALPWQAAAWQWYDGLGEAWFPAAWYGNNLAKARWPVVVGPDRGSPRDEKGNPRAGVSPGALQVAEEAMARLVGQNGTPSSWARAVGELMTVTAEAWLMGYSVNEAGNPVPENLPNGAANQEAIGEVWEAVSPSSLERKEGPRDTVEVRVTRSQTDQKATLMPSDTTLVRLWRPHPRYIDDAMGPMKVLLPDCQLLNIMSMSMRSSALARTHAGLLAIDTRALPPSLLPPTEVPADGTPPPNPLVQKLVAGLATNWKDPLSAGLAVPTALLLTPPGDKSLSDVIVHIPLTRDDEAELLKRMELVVRRIATGLDIPPEILLGMAALNHWSSWLVDEQAYGDHLEPMCNLVADCLKVGYLWPAMKSAGIVDATVRRQFGVGVDASAIVIHPNRSADAKELHDRGEMTGAGLRRYTNFPETDKPTTAELEERVRLGFVKGPKPSAAAAETTEPGAPAQASGTGLSVVRASSFGVAAFRRDSAGIEAQHLRDTLMLCDAAVAEALRKAGSVLKSRAHRNVQLRQQLAGVKSCDIASRLGPRQVHRLAQFDDENTETGDAGLESLYAGALAAALVAYLDVTQAAHGAWRDLVLRLTGYRFNDVDLERMRADAIASQAVLEAGLRKLVEARLLDPASHVLLEGERPAGVSIPATVARRASARAGGTPVVGDVAKLDTWEGGLTSGQTAVDLGAEAGITEQGVIWVYGPALRARPFEPHADLDGGEFTGPDDPELDGPEWGAYYPGDHAGCLCTWALIWEVSGASEETAA